jgi:hypothetical protein
MAILKKPRKLERNPKSSPRERAVNGLFVRELLGDLEAVDGALSIRRIKANDESVEALVKVVTQQGMVLKDLLLALEEDFESVRKAAKRGRPSRSRRANLRRG